MKAFEKLRVVWSKAEKALIFCHPAGSQTGADGHYLYNEVFSPAVQKELDERGYDLRTLRFEISPKAGNPRFGPSPRPPG